MISFCRKSLEDTLLVLGDFKCFPSIFWLKNILLGNHFSYNISGIILLLCFLNLSSHLTVEAWQAHSDILFCTYLCFCRYVWSPKYLGRKSSLFFPFIHVRHTGDNMENSDSCACMYLPPQRCKKNPISPEDLGITWDFVHQLGEIT